MAGQPPRPGLQPPLSAPALSRASSTALGATRRQVLWLVMRQGVGILAAGLAGGMIVAVWVAKTMASLLHHVQPADPVSLAGVSLLLSAIALVAIFLPAYRATHVNAVVALRAE